MALTQVPIELSSTPGIVDNSNATAITIDSSENVGIGTTNPSAYYAKNLVVSAGDEEGITVVSDPAHQGYLMFADGTSGSAAYRGYIGYDHASDTMNLISSGIMRFYSGDPATERMRIDSSGNVSIGVSAANARLEVAAPATTSSDIAYFSNSNGVHKGIIRLDAQGDGEFVLRDAGNNEDVVITAGGDSYFNGGNLLVGDSSATFNDTAKTVIRPSSDNWVIKPTVCTSFNRTASDGDILEFYKGSSNKVGSIGTEGNNIFIGTGDTGVRFSSGTDSVFPIDTSTGNGRDAAVDLGLGSGGRFKDLYLSGGAYLGGTGAANYLEDYEVGTFDLTISSSGFTVSSQTNTYTKIGNTVSIRGRILFSAVLSNGSSVVLTGAPFACNSSIHGVGVARETTTSGDIFTAQVSAGSTTFALTSMDGITVGSNQVLLANKTYDYQVTYQT